MRDHQSLCVCALRFAGVAAGEDVAVRAFDGVAVGFTAADGFVVGDGLAVGVA
jgi:hypothetical protein